MITRACESPSKAIKQGLFENFEELLFAPFALLGLVDPHAGPGRSLPAELVRRLDQLIHRLETIAGHAKPPPKDAVCALLASKGGSAARPDTPAGATSMTTTALVLDDMITTPEDTDSRQTHHHLKPPTPLQSKKGTNSCLGWRCEDGGFLYSEYARRGP